MAALCGWSTGALVWGHQVFKHLGLNMPWSLCCSCYPNIMQLGCRLVAWWLCWIYGRGCHVYALWLWAEGCHPCNDNDSATQKASQSSVL